MEYLLKDQLLKEEDKIYKKWASQFKEKNNYIYVKEWWLISRYELPWILSIFYDNPTLAY